YIFIIAAIVIIPYELGGFGAIFAAAQKAYDAKIAAGAAATPAVKVAAGLTLAPSQVGPYITLAIGSAMALFMYPHALTSTLAASSGRAIRFRNFKYMNAPCWRPTQGHVHLAIAAGFFAENFYIN
ncbi:MAG: sodium:solute symporter, partial [Verrucomicrobiota bacterium]